MKKPIGSIFLALLAALPLPRAHGAGEIFEVTYPPSAKPGELQTGVSYTLWMPEGVKTLRAVIVHQHGCGAGSSIQAETAAYDLHWQALARKWDCAFLAPDYRQTSDPKDCHLWDDPRHGSQKRFLQSLADLGRLSGHPELESIPWCLWGHSGGGGWASLMQVMFPERIVAIWFRSGTAYESWEKGLLPRPEIPEAAMRIPMMSNVGVKENTGRPGTAWSEGVGMFKAYRAKGAPIGFAPDPLSGHETADSRYLAIPFFDVCLGLRLPDKGSADQRLKPIDMGEAWLAPLLGDRAVPASSFQGNANEAVWLPNEAFARKWAEYVKTGEVSDLTPPPPPIQARAWLKPTGMELTWDAEADLESGLQAFLILRDGKQIAQLPEKLVGQYGRPLFQGKTFCDTPEIAQPEMRFVDLSARPGETHVYAIVAVNSVGLPSQPAEAK